jgi:MiaB/RimO family radical SAM methylthiotransferase
VGVLGCMAERLKSKLIEEERLCDVVVGPDAYRSLPGLLARVLEGGEPVMDVALSLDETYRDIIPVRFDGAGQIVPVDEKQAEKNAREEAKPSALVSAYVSITRGCNNMCTYCIVPFTRGRERSRDLQSILDEVAQLERNGCREVVLLGQNVNSYNASNGSPEQAAVEKPVVDIAEGFSTVYKRPVKLGFDFADLLDELSTAFPEVRFRFTSPHPKDFPDRVLKLIASRHNICNSLHMPAQSGSTEVLKAMGRGYSREAYDSLVERIDGIIGRDNVAISSDFISGFCGETEEDHSQTLDLLRSVGFDQAFMFAYSTREKTKAHRRLTDDVPHEVKQRRLREVIDTFNARLAERSGIDVGLRHVVLVEGRGRRDESKWSGRSDTNKRVFFDANGEDPELASVGPGSFVEVEVVSSGKHSMQAHFVRCTTLQAGMESTGRFNEELRR